MEHDLANFAPARTAFAVGWLTILLLWESAQPFFGYFRGRAGERASHGAKNLLVGGINLLATALGFAVLWAWAAGVAGEARFGLLHAAGLPPWLHLAGAIVILDFWMYWWHRLNHRLPILWRFHRTHHSDPRMDVTTASRFHLGEIVISSCLRTAVIFAAGIRLWDLAVYETILFVIVQSHHANIVLPEPLDRALRVVVVTPSMHKVHHSRVLAETNSNYTSILSVWDRLFGTFRLNRNPQSLQYGVDALDRPEDQTLVGLFRIPFLNRGGQRES